MRGCLSSAFAALLILFMSPAAAKADWLRAESERFVIYSDGNERTLRRYVQKLETFDRVLRLFMGLPMDAAPPRKLPIYLIDHHRELAQVLPGAVENQWGVYLTSEQDIFAVAGRSRGDDSTLLHEYAHHFMFQNFNFPYPAWFVEGFAEYYAATTITPARVDVGAVDDDLVYWLRQTDWMPMEALLAGQALTARGNEFNETYYPLAWLLTHWFMADAERQTTLQTYLTDVGMGEDPAEALERHTGLTPEALNRTLRAYVRGGMPYSRVRYAFPEVPISVERLPDSADDLLLVNQRLKFAHGGENSDDLLQEVRDLAARHPGDGFARLVLGRAEILLGDPAAGEAHLTALLAEQPDNVEALQLLAMARREGAPEHPEGYDVAMRQMRGFLQRAYQADDANYFTFLMIAESRIGEPDYPTENDLAAWELAYTIAPQLGQTRFGLAQALMAHDRNAEAILVLQPLANDPHNPGNAATVRMLIERAEAGLARSQEETSAGSDVVVEEAEDR